MYYETLFRAPCSLVSLDCFALKIQKYRTSMLLNVPILSSPASIQIHDPTKYIPGFSEANPSLVTMQYDHPSSTLVL